MDTKNTLKKTYQWAIELNIQLALQLLTRGGVVQQMGVAVKKFFFFFFF